MARILVVDDSPTELYKLTGMLEKHGYEVLKAENGADGYHVSTVHWNYLSTMGQRNYEKGGTEAVDAKSWSNEGGFYSFDNGHMMLWTRLTNPEVRPVYNQLERLEQSGELGELGGSGGRGPYAHARARARDDVDVDVIHP